MGELAFPLRGLRPENKERIVQRTMLLIGLPLEDEELRQVVLKQLDLATSSYDLVSRVKDILQCKG